MAIITGTTQTYQQIGIREDLSNMIYDLSKEDRPFMTSIGRGKAKNTKPEWQIDALAAADETNAVIEGDEATFDSAVATTRLNTFTQIMDKAVVVSDTNNAVDIAGQSESLAFQADKRTRELTRDMEKRLCGNFLSAVGATGTARQTAGALAWLTSNTSFGAGGANGGFSASIVSAATNGTQRAFTEGLLKPVLKLVYDNGEARPTTILVGSAQKQVFSTFAGIAALSNNIMNAKDSVTVVGAAELYKGDFGVYRAVPSPFMSARDAFIYDPKFWEVLYLQPFAVTALARTGHAEKKLLKVEFGLKCSNEKSSGVVRDLT